MRIKINIIIFKPTFATRIHKKSGDTICPTNKRSPDDQDDYVSRLMKRNGDEGGAKTEWSTKHDLPMQYKRKMYPEEKITKRSNCHTIVQARARPSEQDMSLFTLLW